MDDDDKPFVCTAPMCGQKFTNSDHLNVHRQKHQLSLNIGRQGESIVDQTPTPTRFLPKTVEEGGELFEVLPDANPFDQDFRKAAALSKVSTIQSSAQLPVISVSPPETVSSIDSKQSQVLNVSSSSSLRKIGFPNNNNSSIKIIDGSSGKTKNIQGNGTGSFTIVVNSQRDAVSGGAVSAKPSSKRTATVLFAAQNNIPSIIVKQNTEASIEDMPIIGLNSNPTKDLVRSAVPHPAIVTPRCHQNGISDGNKSTKQKLKEILQQNAATSSGVPTTSAVNQQPVSQGYVFPSTSVASPSNSIVSDNSDMMNDDLDDEFRSSPIKRSRRSQEDLDPDERRRKFLERNRAAASRCRQKRKVWVQQLEKKADDLSATNVTLQNEISVLKSEVAQLKALLLAHKDCPVTAQQQKTLIKHPTSGYSNQSDGRITNLSAIIKPRFETDEEVASSALTDMANQSHIVEPHQSPTCVSVIFGRNSSPVDRNVIHN